MLGQHVGFDIHQAARLKCAKCCHCQGVGDEHHREAIAAHVNERQAHSIHGD